MLEFEHWLCLMNKEVIVSHFIAAIKHYMQVIE